jgi:hypothetical protein
VGNFVIRVNNIITRRHCSVEIRRLDLSVNLIASSKESLMMKTAEITQTGGRGIVDIETHVWHRTKKKKCV